MEENGQFKRTRVPSLQHEHHLELELEVQVSGKGLTWYGTGGQLSRCTEMTRVRSRGMECLEGLLGRVVVGGR